MHKSQFDELLEKHGLRHSYGDVPADLDVKLFLTNGRHKNKVGRMTAINGSKISAQVEDAKPVTFIYTQIELADKDGKPILVSALDITGRPVNCGSVICYSVSAGENSHALEIGRIVKTNPSGSLSVQPIIQNGQRITNPYFKKIRANVRADRVILLPVDGTLVTTWVLSDFELYHEDDLIDG